jgi:hypothetical protein
MMRVVIRSLAAALSIALVLSVAYYPMTAIAQGKSDKKQQEKGKEAGKEEKATPKKDETAPRDIMGGKRLGLKSSRQEKDSATMGFNGLDPQGKVEKSMLSASVTNANLVDAKSLVAFAPVQKELDAFVQQGNLKPATMSSTTKDKKK